MGEGRNVYRVLVGKPEGKSPLGRSRRRWEEGVKLDLGEMGWGGGVEWIHLAEDRDRWRAVVNALMNPRHLSRRSSYNIIITCDTFQTYQFKHIGRSCAKSGTVTSRKIVDLFGTAASENFTSYVSSTASSDSLRK
jgi:hypothetical protein